MTHMYVYKQNNYFKGTKDYPMPWIKYTNMCLNVNFDGTTIRLERQVNKSDALRNCDLPDDLCHMNVFECTH